MANLNEVFEHDLIDTGVPNFNHIMGGGYLRNHTILIEGTPGTGKTTFALQFLIAGAEQGEAGILITFEQSFEKLKRDSRSFGWDLDLLVKNKKLKVIYTSPTVLLKELQSPDGVLQREVAAIGAKRLSIDGLAPIRLSLGPQGHTYRESVLLMLESLQRMDLTTVITNELAQTPILGESNFGHEQFLCDTLITLRQDPYERGFTRRSLEIAKARAQKTLSGRHSIEIGRGGVTVYPRAQDPARITTSQPSSNVLESIGCHEVDRMLGGGVYRGSVTLCVGITGTGKSVLGSHFALAATENSENVLYVTLDEHPEQLIRNAEGLGFDLKTPLKNGKLVHKYTSPLELNPDKHLFEVLEHIEKNDVKRVVIDSISAYQTNQQTPIHDFIYAIATNLKNRNITTLFIYENPELIGISQISEDFKVSPIVDNIILFNYVEISNRLRRAITIPKSRGLNPTRLTREFKIDQGGLKVFPLSPSDEKVPQLPFSAYFGILGRSPQRISPHFLEGGNGVTNTELTNGG